MTNFNIYSSKFGQSTDDLPEGEVNLYLTNERVQAVIDSNTNLVKLTDLSWNNITNKPSAFPPSTHSHSWTEITNKPTIFASDWANVADKPATATRWPTWSEVTSKPTTLRSRLQRILMLGLTLRQVFQLPLHAGRLGLK
ncbi:protein of unknown function [Limnospira indica PCC 8005]|uniref:Uncharacterized protein n=1 Tax=Limnospira indica PCC 8005 TaxID=376219 RepID=A0A9P1KEC3_9CYAN|nr:protein of unknown function [Limnospira indica PCC 8005]